MAHAEDAYGSYGSVGNSVADTPAGGPVNVRANPDDFGAQVGGAMQNYGSEEEKSGNEGMDLATHYAEMATNAKASDIIANKIAPQLSQTSSDYYRLQGMDAVNALPAYSQQRQQIAQQYISQASSPLEKQRFENFFADHATRENDQAAKFADGQFLKFTKQSSADYLDLTSSDAVSNYNNPQVFNQKKDQAFGQITLNAHDQDGIDPSTPQGAAIVQDRQRQWLGSVTQMSISRAMANGDLSTAQKLYADNRDSISGKYLAEIEGKLHTENMRSYGVNGVDAIMNGQPIPEAPIGATSNVRAAVVKGAQNSGVDPSLALATANVESGFGQNVGKRGDIGQTGKPASSIDEQVSNMNSALKDAQGNATSAVGRTPQPWETYLCYQQGAGGGPALLKTAANSPDANAIKTLSPLYEKDHPGQGIQLATQAVTNNGGSATMSVAQFCGTVKDNFNQHYTQSAVITPTSNIATVAVPTGGDKPVTDPAPPSLPDAIVKPHQQGGVAFQPGATPIQTYKNFQEVYPQMMQRVMQIPDIDRQEALIRGLDQKEKLFHSMAEAQKSTFETNLNQFGNDPKFTDWSQVPDSISSGFNDIPASKAYLEQRMKYNLANTGNIVNDDKTSYGSGWFKALDGVLRPTNVDGSVKSISQLYPNVGIDKDLTPSGFDRLDKYVKMKSTPDGQSELSAIQTVMHNGQQQILGGRASAFSKDPVGDQKVERWTALALSQYEKGRDEGKSVQELTDPKSADYIGKTVDPFMRTTTQISNDQKKYRSLVGPAPQSPQVYVADTHPNNPAVLQNPPAQTGDNAKNYIPPPPAAQREVNKTYQSVNGPVIWTGTGWKKAQ